METPLTLLYTHHLRGDLDVLPRLYNFLRQLKAHYSEEVVQVCADDPAQAPGRVLLLDLGESCAPEVWHCEASGGRSTLVVLDGMGYDAVRVEDARGKQAKMGEGVQLHLVDAETPLEIEDVLITAGDSEGELAGQSHSLEIVLSPSESTHFEGKRLFLAELRGGQQVGVARLNTVVGRWVLGEHEVHELPRRILPDPTISAAVEFVVSEARYAQKRKST